MTYEHGRILAVNEVTLGSELVGDTLAGVLSLTVEDPVDFDEGGGSLVINGQVIEYTTYDDDTGEITLAEALAAAAEEGDHVSPYDPYYAVASTEKIAQVELDGDDYNTDPIEANLAHHLVKELGEGIRGIRGESCLLELDGDEWRVIDVLGLGKSEATGHRSQIDQFTVTGTGTSAFTLSQSALNDSWNVTLNGVTCADGDEYTINGTDLSVVGGADLFNGASAADPWLLQAQYDYLVAGATPTVTSDPESVVGFEARELFNTTVTRSYPVGTAEGDLLVMAIGTGAVLSVPADWTLQAEVTVPASSEKLSVLTRAAGTETSVTTTTDAVSWQNGVIVTYRGGAVASAATATSGANATYTSSGGAPWHAVCLMVIQRAPTTTPAYDGINSGTASGLVVAHTEDGSAVVADAYDPTAPPTWAVVTLNLVGA